MSTSNLVCPPSSILSISLLDKYIPSPSLQTAYSPILYRAIGITLIASLVLCAITLANGIYASESIVDQKMKSLFPDERRRREYLLEKVEEIDNDERIRQEVLMRRELLRGLVRDAVSLEKEMEMGGWED